MKNLLLVMLLLFAIQTTQAQAHQMGAKYNCKLKKGNSNAEGYPCEACSAKNKKEQDAKIVEDKRRADVAMAKAKAEKEVAEKARLEKLAEEKKNAESGNVYINRNKSAVATNNITQPKNIGIIEKNYFYASITDGENNGFIVNGKIILNNNEFLRCIALPHPDKYPEFKNRYQFPPNIGIVILKEKYISPPQGGRVNSLELPIYDLVDSKGNRILNDDKIMNIVHFYGDYFILYKGPRFALGYTNITYLQDDVEIYNIKTKKIIHVYEKNNGRVEISEAIWYPENYGGGSVMSFSKENCKAIIKVKVYQPVKKDVFYFINNSGEVETKDAN